MPDSRLHSRPQGNDGTHSFNQPSLMSGLYHFNGKTLAKKADQVPDHMLNLNGFGCISRPPSFALEIS